MHLYTYVSIAVVALTTTALFMIFRRNNMKDYRYHLGLFLSAIIAITASLLLPDMMTVITLDWALQFTLAFFIAFLVYITLLLLVMILIASVFSQKKMDKINEKYLRWKAERQQRKETRRKLEEDKRTVTAKATEEGKDVSGSILKEVFADKLTGNQASSATAEVSKEQEESRSEEEYVEQVFNEAAATLEESLEKTENDEKNVDTPDIIDKMGVDMISNANSINFDTAVSSLDEMLEKAFVLKQNGREMEAASLYTDALGMKPDNEVVFWIVIDLCVIYKNAGLHDLAEDILQAYIDEYEGLMSEEVKDQILQSLYS